MAKKRLDASRLTDADILAMLTGFDFFNSQLGDPHNADAYALYKAAWEDPAVRRRVRDLQTTRKRCRPIWAVQRFGDPDLGVDPEPVVGVPVKYVRYTSGWHGGRVGDMARKSKADAAKLIAAGDVVEVTESPETEHLTFYPEFAGLPHNDEVAKPASE